MPLISGCADIAYRPDTEGSYRYPSPSLERDEDVADWKGDIRAEMKKLRTSLVFINDNRAGWVYSEYRDRAKETVFKIAHLKGDLGALKVQCAIGGKSDQSLDIFVHHPVLCGDGTIEGQVWEKYWQESRPPETVKARYGQSSGLQTGVRLDQSESGRNPLYEGAYKTLSNRGRATRGACKTHWVGKAQEENSHFGDWVLALLASQGTGNFRTIAHTEIDVTPLIMHHEKTGEIFDHQGASYDLEYNYDLKVDLRYGKRNLVKVLEACGY